jgi:hypothetical protein
MAHPKERIKLYCYIRLDLNLYHLLLKYENLATAHHDIDMHGGAGVTTSRGGLENLIPMF